MTRALYNPKMNRNERRLSKLASELHLYYDDTFDYLYGIKNGFKLFVDNPFSLARSSIIFAVKKNDALPDLKEISSFINNYQIIKYCHYKNYQLNFKIKHQLLNLFTKDRMIIELNTFINDFTLFLTNKGYHDCCQNCGSDSSSYALINEGKFLFCNNCYDIADILVEAKATTFKQADELYALGVLGAICGSLIGGFSIVLFDQVGFIMVFSGLIMATCTLKGYKLLAGRHSKKGIITSIIIMAAMTYISHRLSWSFSLAEYYKTSLWIIFRNFNSLILEGYVNTGYYFLDLFTVIIFSFIGSITTILSIKHKNDLRKLFKI